MSTHYNVAPRYTPGSPALVDEATARRVASEEQDALHYILQGFEGPDAKRRAQHLGLRGVAEARRERGSGKKQGWEIEDLCTGERFFRLCAESLRKLGWREYNDLTQWERALVDKDPPLDVEDYRKAHYKLAPDMGPAGLPGWKITVYRPSTIE